jgi:hypothetical protein
MVVLLCGDAAQQGPLVRAAAYTSLAGLLHLAAQLDDEAPTWWETLTTVDEVVNLALQGMQVLLTLRSFPGVHICFG